MTSVGSKKQDFSGISIKIMSKIKHCATLNSVYNSITGTMALVQYDWLAPEIWGKYEFSFSWTGND